MRTLHAFTQVAHTPHCYYGDYVFTLIGGPVAEVDGTNKEYPTFINAFRTACPVQVRAKDGEGDWP